MNTATTRFEVGQKYVTRFIGDSDLKIYATIVKRTDKMVTMLREDGSTYSRKVRDHYGVEIFSTASYSMAPMFSADRRA